MTRLPGGAALRVLLALLLSVGGATSGGVAGEERAWDSATRLGTLHLFVPPSREARAFVLLFSDDTGWTERLDRVGRSLASAGMLVGGVDLPAYLGALRRGGDECLDLTGEIEDLSWRLQRELDVPRYRGPVLAGIGSGGLLAYAALAQAPAATLTGAVSIDPAPVLPTRMPTCGGAPAEPRPEGIAYGAKPDLPGLWTTGLHPDHVGDLPWADGLGKLELLPESESAPDALARLVRALVAAESARPAPAVADLPIVELAPAHRAEALAVIVSGDGGWRDLDKVIGEDLAADDIGVVGLDSLRYFWSRKDAVSTAHDLERVLRHYGEAWGVHRVILVGYSFGASVLPATIRRLPSDLRSAVDLVVLLAPDRHTDFEIHVAGWVGVGSPGQPVIPDAVAIEPARLICVYGEEEEDSLCTAPLLAAVERVRTGGGHHFDGDYARLAELIRRGFTARKSR